MKTNEFTLTGNLGDNPETPELKSGKELATFSLAETISYKDSNGEKQKKTQWHQVECWERQAKIAKLHLKKGVQVQITGRINYNQYETKEGEKRTATILIANSILLVPSLPKE